jgi:hypothetical protein
MLRVFTGLIRGVVALVLKDGKSMRRTRRIISREGKCGIGVDDKVLPSESWESNFRGRGAADARVGLDT